MRSDIERRRPIPLGEGGLNGWKDILWVMVAAAGMVALLYLAALSMIGSFGYRRLVSTPVTRLGRLFVR
jgi:hypothetical protein